MWRYLPHPYRYRLSGRHRQRRCPSLKCCCPLRLRLRRLYCCPRRLCRCLRCWFRLLHPCRYLRCCCQQPPYPHRRCCCQMRLSRYLLPDYRPQHPCRRLKCCYPLHHHRFRQCWCQPHQPRQRRCCYRKHLLRRFRLTGSRLPHRLHYQPCWSRMRPLPTLRPPFHHRSHRRCCHLLRQVERQALH